MPHVSFHPIAQLLWISTLLLGLLAGCGRLPETAKTATLAIPSPTVRETTIRPTISAPVPTSTTEKDTPALRWLAGTPCQTPCWEQIIPGTTTITDANRLLSRLDSVVNLQHAAEYNNSPALISWQWKKYTRAGGSVTFYSRKPAFADPPLNVVLSISLALDHPLTLQDIIATYGEPSHIQLAADNNPTLGVVYYFSVVYLDKGFLLQTQTNDFSRKPALNSRTTFDYIQMFESSTQGFDRAIEPSFPIRQPSQFLVAWAGFDTDINTYCRDIRPDAAKRGCD